MKSPNKPTAKKPRSIEEKKQLARAVLERLRDLNPEPRTELFYLTDFQLLVSVVLSAQTTDKMVNRCMEPAYKAGFTARTVLEWGEQKLLQTIRTVGLAPTKAKNVYKLSQIVQDRYQGRVPKTREELEALPGVGRKTANVVLGALFNEPTLPVDTHVFRVTRRLGLQNATTPEKAEQALLKVVDADLLPNGHHWFILHGRYVCKAQSPDCEHCAVNDLCPSAFTVKRETKGPSRLSKGSNRGAATRQRAAKAVNQ